MSGRKNRRKSNRKPKRLGKKEKPKDTNKNGNALENETTEHSRAFCSESPFKTLQQMFESLLTVSPADSTDESDESEESSQESVDENEPGPSSGKVSNKNRRKQAIQAMSQLLPLDINIIEENSIFQAIITDNYNLLKVLLEDGNAPGEIVWRDSGESALHAAIKQDNIKMFHLLIAHGANINTCASPGKNCLYFAAGKNNYEMVEYMCKVYTRTSRSGRKWREGYPALFAACAMGHEKIVSLLISSGVDLKARTEGFLTPLHIAVERGYLKIVELLLKGGFDVNETTAEGCSVLHYAVQRESTVLVEMFLDFGADMNLRSTNNESPYYLAVTLGFTDIVKIFINRGVNVNKF